MSAALVAVPSAASTTGRPRACPSTVKLTVPVGVGPLVPACGAIVAVKVTGWPNDGDASDAANAVVVAALSTVTVVEPDEAAVPASPA